MDYLDTRESDLSASEYLMIGTKVLVAFIIGGIANALVSGAIFWTVKIGTLGLIDGGGISLVSGAIGLLVHLVVNGVAAWKLFGWD